LVRKFKANKRFVVPANTVSLPAYAVDDLTIIFKKEFNKLNFSFKTTVFNLFNERYEIVEHAPLPGRNWRFGLDITY